MDNITSVSHDYTSAATVVNIDIHIIPPLILLLLHDNILQSSPIVYQCMDIEAVPPCSLLPAESLRSRRGGNYLMNRTLAKLIHKSNYSHDSKQAKPLNDKPE